MIFDIDFGGSNSAAIPGFDAEVTEKILNGI